MGNTPSVEAHYDQHHHHKQHHLQPPSHKSSSSSRRPKPPHKLSKPRVGNHASSTSTTSTAAGLLSPNGYATAPSSTTRLPSNPNLLSYSYSRSPAPSPVAAAGFKPADIVPPDTGATQDAVEEEEEYRPAPISKDWYRRSTLFRSKSSQEDRREKGLSVPVMAPKIGDRMSRANSMTWESKVNMDYARQQVDGWNAPGNRQSVNYNLSSYESQRLLGLSEESAAYENDSVLSESKFEVVTEHTWKSSHPHQASSANLSRANSDLSLYAPMRRRSIIQTPGLATRKPGDVPLSRKSSFRHSHPATPGHSRRNSMESSPARILSMPPPRISHGETVERVVTPCESDYKQLGGMKFGSLRITNGAASPAPSPEVERRREDVGSRSSNESGKETYFVQPTKKSAVENRKTAEVSTITTTIVQPKPMSRILSPITTSFLQATSIARKSTSLVKTSPTQPADVQPEYLGGLYFSPFSLTDSRTPSPELQTTSKHTALEDDLFEDEIQLEYSSVEILDVREDPNAKTRHERPRPDPAQKSGRNVTRSDSGFVSSPTSDVSHKPLTKADSGYSSNVSLRSFTSRPPVPDKDHGSRSSPERLTLDLPESGSSFLGDFMLPSPTSIKPDGVVPNVPNRTAPAPPLPPKDPSQVSPTKTTMAILGPNPHIALLAAPSSKKHRKTPAPIDSTKLYDSGPLSPESLQLSPASSDTSTSALSIGSGSHRPGKLFRLLSGAGLRGPPSVHVTHPVNQSIPSVPQDVEAKFHEHTGLFPMTTKRLALRTQASKETLKTIFSVASYDVGNNENPRDSLVSLAESQAGGRETPKPLRRRSFQSVPASIMHAAASVLPRNPSHRKPVPTARKEHESKETREKDTASDEIQNGFESNVTSIDCIRNSVGNSAFDQAFAAMAEERDVYFSPTGRTMTMTAQLERDLELRMHASKPKPSNDGLLPVASPISPLMQELTMPKKTRTPPPVSMRTRSVKNLRVPPPLRPQSTPAGGMDEAIRQSLSRQASRESIRSYPQATPPVREESTSPPPVPPMNPRRSMSLRSQEQVELQHQLSQSQQQQQYDQDSWRPNKPSELGRRGSVSNQGINPGPGIQRPASATPYAPQNQQPQLRHRSSYDGQGQSQHHQQQQQQRRGTPQGRHHPNAQTPSHSGSYYQHQLLQLQQQQWGGDGLDQQGRYPPYVPRTGHHRNRSTGSQGHGSHGTNPPPFRILHSYNSPAYRHVPIWG